MEINLNEYAFILIGLCGCGMLGGGQQEALPGEGKGDFGEAFPVELCLGGARLVPFSDAAESAGLCVSESAKIRACSQDGECAGIESCVCGRCIVQACKGAASCENGLVCRGKRCTASCAEDGECKAGERCISGGCARSCSSDAQCHTGERCDSLDQVCTVKLCGSGLLCGSGYRCESVREGADVREPNLIQLNNQSIAFFELRSADLKSSIYRARVDSSLRWTVEPELPVLSPENEEIRMGAPSLRMEEGGSLWLYAEAAGLNGVARIVRAKSSDLGFYFERDPMFSFEPGMEWEAGRVGSPSVFSFQGGEYFFYEGGSGAGIGLARLNNGTAERTSQEALIKSLQFEDPFFWRGITSVGAPYALVLENVLYVYASVRGAEGADTIAEGENKPALLNDSIGLVTSRDLLRFESFAAGPVYARTVNLRTVLGEREPSVALAGDRAFMVFVSADAAGEQPSGLYRTESRK